MTFTSLEFPIFFALVFALYWALPRRAHFQNALLLAVSYIFYASWYPRLVWIVALATAVDYFAAIAIERYRGSPAKMRAALAVSLVYNLGQLAYFKYAGFFVFSLDRLLRASGLGGGFPTLKILLPLGISFFTFQKLAYVIDVYWERQKACRSPLAFASFVAFFPQLVAGPIVRAGDMLPQYESPRRLDTNRFADGASIFILGLVKKAFVADWLGQYVVDPIFKDQELYSTGGHWIALVGYAAQVFCDFSGYSEMAIGCGRFFGLELPRNFNYPFLSRTPIEMWRRWHITLNTWLFDYIYTPLTTGQNWMRGRLDLGFLVVFLASGFWHGARWTYALWGALHGVALIVHRQWDVFFRGLCRKDRSWVAVRKSVPYSLAAWFLTNAFFVLTLVPFRAPSLTAAGAYARALIGGKAGLLLPLEAPRMRAASLALCFAIVVGHHLLELGSGPGLRERFFAMPPLARGAAYGLVIVYLLLFVPVASGAFIYAQF
jgi:alginate O-acetyltransferase complex protein AlgI